mmetsp:Transcript_2781/g.4629  ORF Transcript_2781/g.4629 Transcript_2781/m.4629 type:complete len:105 (-) Transcript_2781:458-772(-)
MSKQNAKSAEMPPDRYVLKSGTCVFAFTAASFCGTSPSLAMAKNTLGCPNKEHSVVDVRIVVVPKATTIAAHGIFIWMNASDSGAFRLMSVYLIIPVKIKDTTT